MKLNFDELRKLIDSIDAPAQREGIFRLQIANLRCHYDFHRLKQTVSYNPDLFGFGLNHYSQLLLPQQIARRSRFHDAEDVCVDIRREEFHWAQQLSKRHIVIKTRNWSGQLTW